MAKKRIARLNEQVRRELTTLLQRDVRDPRIGVLTITDVEISPDLYHAKVFYSVMGEQEDRDRAAAGLRAAAGFLRSEIGRRLHIRRAPELHFAYDDTLRHAMHIERLLQDALATTSSAVDTDRDTDTDTDTDDDTDAEACADDDSGVPVHREYFDADDSTGHDPD